MAFGTAQPVRFASGVGHVKAGICRFVGIIILVAAFPLLDANATAEVPRIVLGLDHVPLAVRDLELAAADFKRLGFTLKPGRLHEDGIRNVHVKFPNGGGIELISAISATDGVAAAYVAFLAEGEGPAFWSLYSPELEKVGTFLDKQGLQPELEAGLIAFASKSDLHQLFFASRGRSPTDGPRYWAHANTAFRLGAVWIKAVPREQRLIAQLGAALLHSRQCAPFTSGAVGYEFPGERDRVMVTPAPDGRQDRQIIGLTVLVTSLASARKVLAANRVRVEADTVCIGRSIWVPPSAAHGVWLEFREESSRSRFD